MRILTVRQPWAWAIIHGGKDVENRVRNVAGGYRGPVAIHVAKAIAGVTFRQYRHLTELGYKATSEQNLGQIIGVVDIIGVHGGSTCLDCTEWGMTTDVHIELSNARALSDPIPFKGALGLRTLDDETAERVLALTHSANPEGTP